MPNSPPKHNPRPVKAIDVIDRPSAAKRGYNRKWRAARETFLAANPLCCKCKPKGLIIEATVVDHVVPHRGDSALFWDSSNWQPLCRSCHDAKTIRGG